MATFQQPFTITANATFGLSQTDKTPGMAISNGGLTATVTTNNGTWQGVRSTHGLLGLSNNAPFSAQTGPTNVNYNVYFEVTANVSSERWMVGVVSDTYNLNFPWGPGMGPLVPTRNYYQTVSNSQTTCAHGLQPFATYKPNRYYTSDGTGGDVFDTVHGVWSRTITDVGWICSGTTPLRLFSNATIGVVLQVNVFLTALTLGSVAFTNQGMQSDGHYWMNGYYNEGGFHNSQNTPPDAGLVYSGMPPGPLYVGFFCPDIGAQATFNFGDRPFLYGTPQNFVPWISSTALIPSNVITDPGPIVPWLNATQPSSNSQVPLTWPSAGAGVTYTIQTGATNGNAGRVVSDTNWITVGTTQSTSFAAASQGTNETPFRLRANNGPWTPIRNLSPSFPTPATWPIYLQSATTTSLTIQIQPGMSIDGYNVYWLPIVPSTILLINSISLPPTTLNTFGFVSVTASSFTLQGLQPNTNYAILMMVVVNGVEQDGGQISATALGASRVFSTLPAPGIATGGGEDPLVLTGTEIIPWAGILFVSYPVAATQFGCIFIDSWAYSQTDAMTFGNGIAAHLDNIYNQCVQWFGTQSNQWPCLPNSLNPTGALFNIVATAGQPFGGSHAGCASADIVISAGASGDMGWVDLACFQVTAELTEVFMPNLQSLPDCDQHALGEGLSIAMANFLFPAVYPNQQGSSLNTAAYYLNTATNSQGQTADMQGAVGPFVQRGDSVNINPPGETILQFAAIGCATLFFGYLISQLGYTFTQICSALNALPPFATLRQLYNHLNGGSDDPFPTFVGLLNAHFPQNVQVDSLHFTQNPFPLS